MSDPYFDAARAAGEYPPKGYGYKSDDEKREMVKRYIEKDRVEPWVVREARWLRVEIPDGCKPIL